MTFTLGNVSLEKGFKELITDMMISGVSGSIPLCIFSLGNRVR
jgi:hypothetical protein